MLGQDDIQNKKHGFLTGNKVYYIGGVYLSQHCNQNETIGLTHPFHHDLRSRGTGIATYDGVGSGNDFSGWEFHRATKVLYGSVVTDEMRWENPAPSRMFWRPDKMITEYNLTSPWLQGDFDGWCQDWAEGSSSGTGLGKSFWVDLTKDECWGHCDDDEACNQAVFEAATATAKAQCWIGVNQMTDAPTSSRCPTCADVCHSKSPRVLPVNIREEKFISSTDVVSTIIKSDRPVTLEFTGRSFSGDAGGAGKVVELHGECTADVISNSIRVLEGGTVKAQVGQNPDVFLDAKLMYDGMSGVISASRPMENLTFAEVSPGVCGYTFQVKVDSAGTVLSWTMHDDYQAALKAVREVLAGSEKYMTAKTAKMNGVLNNVVPYFRCSDNDMVKVYYFLWSIYLMYFTQGDQGMQTIPHTQSAVNNFLGMHRFDAVFQIRAGAWTSPAYHDFYANGNVLVWSKLLEYRRQEQLPDNFGTTWASGCYGPETIAHVDGACEIFEHSGNMTFLAQAYAFYKTLFWEGIGGKHFNYAYDAVLCLNRMAELLGHPEDASHWNASVGMDSVQDMLKNQWQLDTPNMFGSTSGGMSWSNVAAAGMSMFPREWVELMARHWLDNSDQGFLTEIGLSRVALKDWTPDNDVFAFVPDGNWYMLRPLYQHHVDDLANKFTLRHLKKYNMEWGIPVAPEARNSDRTLFGDQYNNFNAGKLLLFLEGIGGLSYSVREDSFTFADNLPLEWTFMEFQVPVQKDGAISWVKARAERTAGRKTVTVESSPFGNLLVQPWAEGKEVASSTPSGAVPDAPIGHVGWHFTDGQATVSLELMGSQPEEAWV
jgi:hypothetical protein